MTWLRWKVRIFYIMIWTFVALCFATQAYLEYSFNGGRLSWTSTFIWEISSWLTWAALAPLALLFIRRFPLSRATALRFLPTYILAAVMFSSAHLVINVAASTTCYELVRSNYQSQGIYEALQLNLFSRITWRLFVFSIVIIGCYALDAQRKFQEQEGAARELQVQLARAQLQALKMQMHPHFLFNTLHSLSELIHRDVRAAEEMIVRLGDFLRLSLRDPEAHEVPLRKELEFLQCYLDIEKLRLQDRLEVTIEVGENVMDMMVPYLILQPLVENAVRHGISPSASGGRIKIHAGRTDSVLQIEVSDSGCGPAQTLDPESLFQKGLGLNITRERLQKMYGTGKRLQLTNSPSGGFSVTLEIPAQQFRPKR